MDHASLAPAMARSKEQSEWTRVVLRFRRNLGAPIGAGILVFLALVAIVGPYLVADPLKQDIAVRIMGPNSSHLMGTDDFGRDIFARVVNGARISIVSGMAAVVVGLVFGCALGIVAGYYEGKLGTAIMAVMDMLLALPAVLLAISIAALLGPSLVTATVAVGIVNIPYFARLIRSAILSVKHQDYLDAARIVGASDLRMIRLHLVPNSISPVIVQGTVGVGNAILLVASLGFLGLGAQPPTPEWGVMLNDARRFIVEASYMGIFPGLGIMLTVLGFNLAGDGLREALDPSLQ